MMNSIEAGRWTFDTIGILRSPCREKFAVPRQSGLAPALKSRIEIFSPYDRDEAFQSLLSFSHIWVLGIFHLARRDDWQPTVRPPRLGGNERVGVFASRSPFRPNPVSLSVFRLTGIERLAGKLYLNVSGTDMVDRTPVIDIKPYVPYADKPSGVKAGYTDCVEKPELCVEFTRQALEQCRQYQAEDKTDLRELITQLVALDPRPAYREDKGQRQYGVSLYDLNVRFEVMDQTAKITSISRQKE
jgi:tRNA-Thr(GGU) m(6)t(6)A37 methyltransferase TsaA